MKPILISDAEIRMPYISHGSLDRYMNLRKTVIDDKERRAWIQNAAEIISRVHRQRVIIADIAATEFPSQHRSITPAMRFSESLVVPEDKAPGMSLYRRKGVFLSSLTLLVLGRWCMGLCLGVGMNFMLILRLIWDLGESESKTCKE